MPKKGKRHVPPSKEKYDRENPVVSVRVSKELFAEIEALRAQGRSLGDIFRVGIGRQNAADRSLEEARKQGYEQGFAAARARYMISYRCGRCGDLIELTGDKAKAFAAASMEKGGWKHVQCPQPQRPQRR